MATTKEASGQTAKALGGREMRGVAALAAALAFALAPAVPAKECEASTAPVRPACADLPPGHPPVPCDGLPAGHPPVALLPGLPPGHPPVFVTPEGPAADLPPGHPEVHGTRKLPPGHPPLDRFPAELPIFDQDAPQTL